ncbi:MAG: hypothetical protein JNM00_05115, partial [Flavobacteriales bacterium]|nr:hypothetical protein [Flavobacteriales bacterium]
MKQHLKYDPEDIESLMRHKRFDELYAEEKEFVLQHLDNKEEYESIRRTLFEIQAAQQNDQWLEPDASIRHNLMAEFEVERRNGFTVWLNSLFAMPLENWSAGRKLAFAVASVVLVSAILFWALYPSATPPMAVNDKKESTEKLVQSTPPAASIQSAEVEDRPLANAQAEGGMPASPVIIESESEEISEDLNSSVYEGLAEEVDMVKSISLDASSDISYGADDEVQVGFIAADEAEVNQTYTGALNSSTPTSAKEMQMVDVVVASKNGAKPAKTKTLSTTASEDKALLDL